MSVISYGIWCLINSADCLFSSVLVFLLAISTLRSLRYCSRILFLVLRNRLLRRKVRRVAWGVVPPVPPPVLFCCWCHAVELGRNLVSLLFLFQLSPRFAWGWSAEELSSASARQVPLEVRVRSRVMPQKPRCATFTASRRRLPRLSCLQC